MSIGGLSNSSRIVCIVLAVGVHAAAASAFMLAPKAPPPVPLAAVEVELLAEITAEVADQMAPSVVAELMEARQATEALPGEVKDITGKEVGVLAALSSPQLDVEPTEAKEVEEAKVEPEAEDITEAEPVDEPTLAKPVEPLDVEKPIVETQEAPVIPAKPKPAKKKVQAQKKIKTQQQRAMVASTSTNRNVGRTGASQAESDGGKRASAAYRSIVNARLAGRRSAFQSATGSAKGRVTISFTIASSGSVVSASVLISSGNARLDAAARSVVASTSFPPPPKGSFRSSVPFLSK